MKTIEASHLLAENVICFTTTRHSGESVGSYSGLNVGLHVNDERNKVLENRKLLSDYLSNELIRRSDNAPIHGLSPVFLKQTHSNRVCAFDTLAASSNESRLSCDLVNADAVVSEQLLAPLAIMTADCLPIVVVDTAQPKTGTASPIAYAAIHAGWKGLANGIIEKTLSAFSRPLSSEARVWIGPSICQKHFETGHEQALIFKDYPSCVSYETESDKYHIDLAAIATQQLKGLGLKNIEQSGDCTYCNTALFSHRRSTHQKETNCGRMATIICAF